MGFFDFGIKFQNIAKRNYNFFIEQYKKDGNNLPNIITELRLVFGLLVSLFLCFSSNSKFLQWVVFVMFILVAMTDMIDGSLARKLNKVTELGKFLDPVVDKLFMGVILFPVLFIYKELWQFIVIIIICEGIVSWINYKKTIPVNWLGKFRMIVQCVALSFLFLPIDNLSILKEDLIVLAMIVNIASMISYVLRSWKE